MTSTAYPADRTSLLIVNPYNDFMSQGGKVSDLIKPTADATGLFENLRQILPTVREAQIPVFIVPHHRASGHGNDYGGWKNLSLFVTANTHSTVFQVGTRGGEFSPEFGTHAGDVIVKEHWDQNGFATTDLDLLLKQHGVQKVLAPLWIRRFLPTLRWRRARQGSTLASERSPSWPEADKVGDRLAAMIANS